MFNYNINIIIKMSKEETKKYKVVIEDEEDSYYKQIYEEVKKQGAYHRHYNDELLLREKNGVKTYFDMIFISTSSPNPHVEYVLRINVGKLYMNQRIYKSLESKELKLNDIKKYIARIKNFKFCEKCGCGIDDRPNCSCFGGDDKYKETITLKKILNLPIETDNCPICLEEIKNTYDAIYFVKCEKPHYFHLHCLCKINDATCPICKTHCHHLKYRNNYYNFMCDNHHEDDDYFSEEDDF